MLTTHLCVIKTVLFTTLFLGSVSVQGQNLDLATLPSAAGCRYFGGQVNSIQGDSISPAGDVNGDGYADFIMGACFAQNGTFNEAGAAYVFFGKASGYSDFDVSSFDTSNSEGFRITISEIYVHVGYAVSSAGDWNGDGYDDVIIGSTAGAAWVVFGKPTGHSNIDLNSFSTSNIDGFKISAAVSTDGTGRAVAGADVNGDSLGDLIISAPVSSEVYVILGRTSLMSNISLSSFTGSDLNGYKISGSNYTGEAVAPAGDFNNDGYEDILVSHQSPCLIYGKASGFENINLSANPLPLECLKFETIGVDSSTGRNTSGDESPLSSAGDFNGDGFSDIAIASIGSSYDDGQSYDGSIFVVWGRAETTNTIALSSITATGTEGFRIDGLENSRFGLPLSCAGDVNNDGFDDLVAALGGDFNGRRGSDATYLVYGRATVSENISLASNFLTGIDGYRMEGAVSFGYRHDPIGAGDVNNDGFDDMVIKQSYYINNRNIGIGYLVFGANIDGSIDEWSAFEAGDVTVQAY